MVTCKILSLPIVWWLPILLSRDPHPLRFCYFSLEIFRLARLDCLQTVSRTLDLIELTTCRLTQSQGATTISALTTVGGYGQVYTVVLVCVVPRSPCMGAVHWEQVAWLHAPGIGYLVNFLFFLFTFVCSFSSLLLPASSLSLRVSSQLRLMGGERWGVGCRDYCCWLGFLGRPSNAACRFFPLWIHFPSKVTTYNLAVRSQPVYKIC